MAFVGLAYFFGGVVGALVGLALVVAWWRGVSTRTLWIAGLSALVVAPFAVLLSGIPPAVRPGFGEHTLAGHVLVGIGLACILLAVLRELPSVRTEPLAAPDSVPDAPTVTTEPEFARMEGPTGNVTRTVVIGLDGATWSVLGPMLEAGVMPALATLLGRSASGVLRSTFPPYTPPAWTTALTGVNPGRHGIFGFVRGPGSAPELVHWGAVRAPGLWDLLGDASIGLFHVPLTYPPPRVRGWCVSAVWMPTGRRIDGYTSPASLQSRIEALVPGYAPVLGVDVKEDWRGTDLALEAAAVVRDRKRVLSDLLEHSPTDVVFAVLETPDRLHHAYYRYLDPADPMSKARSATLVREAASDAFAELDGVVGLLDQYAGPDGVAIVCSDHGATGWDGYLNGNALLERAGLLSMHAQGRAMARIGGTRLGSAAARALPRRTAIRMRRRSASLVEWPATQAYAARLGTQGFSVNLAGREEHGAVTDERADGVIERLRVALEGVRTPAGKPFAAAIRTRDETYTGPFAAEAPDVLVEPEGWHWEISDRYGVTDLFDDFSGLPLGCHHPDGVFALRAKGVRKRSGVVADIADLTPTLLYAAGAAVPDGLDGRARTELFGQRARPVVQAPQPSGESPAQDESPYTEEEEAQIVKYLTDLGYLG